MSARWRLLLPGWLRSVPADLAAVIALVLVTLGAVFLPVVSETPLRVVVGLPFVLFVPGYAFIAALFPEAGAGPVGDASGPDDEPVETLDDGGIDGIERVALSFGTSIAIVPLIGLVLNFTPWGIRLVPIMVSVSGFTLLAAGVGVHRRNELPADEQFHVPYREWLAAGREELFDPETRIDGALNVLLVVSILLAVSSVGYAVAVPKQGEQFTELYLLTESDDGDLVADDYPQNFTAGEPQSLYVGVGNNEHRTVDYSVVVAIQNVTFENNESRVLQEERLRTFETTLAHNETWQLNHTVAPTLTGDDLRLTYFLYKGDPAANPTVDNAYREVHLWVNVSTRGTAG
ncbi:DUF1616 domain-containing protein [Halorarius halobius]|uniref:DUF1616 domain-containing protein n=1 Tax=Halorarius halobius TaxID=2962671 RepID=UPI0020CB9C06|nr:DUF1616 domain-containing protein [Halorarius halobius]